MANKKKQHTKTVTSKNLKNKWSSPILVTDIDIAFPGNIIGRLLPPMAGIPEEFSSSENKWRNKASRLFFNGGGIDIKPDINKSHAIRHLRACLGSFEPKHEHKVAGVGYLLSLWCNSPE